MGKSCFTKFLIFLTVVFFIWAVATVILSEIDKGQDKINYPTTRRDDSIIEELHGVKVADPYRYLEDSNREDTHQFISAQTELLNAYLSKSKSRDVMREKLTQLWNYPKGSVPMRRGTKTFEWQNSGVQNQSVLYVRDLLNGPFRKLLDPNEMNKDGLYSVSTIGISDNGQYVGYAVAENGSDWQTIKVRDVKCGHDLTDTLQYIKITAIVWTRDNAGFFYQRYPKPLEGYGQTNGTEVSVNLNLKVYYHKIGTYQDDDVVIIEFPEHPTWKIGIEVSDDGDYLFVHASEVIGDRYLYFADLKQGLEFGFTKPLNVVQLTEQPGSHSYVANDGPLVYILTNIDAPNSRVVKFELTNPAKRNWKNAIAQTDSEIQWVMAVSNTILCVAHLQKLRSRIQLRDMKYGTLLGEVPLGSGTATGWYGRRVDKDFYIRMESYTNPGKIYRIEFKDGGKLDMQVHKEVQMDSLNLSHLTTRQFEYSSNDGTNIPLTLIYKKGLVLDGSNPCLFTAYGGFFANTLPTFSATYLFFANYFDGVVAIANIRGGGEHGKQWWDDGRLLNKQNSFDDFIAGARFLIHNRYTTPELLTIQGHSNGGLLIGAVVNQRPDLFGAAIPQQGIMDMLRFHKFTIAHQWTGEYGSPEDVKYFEYLMNYSPLHNIRVPKNENVSYPAILVTTADHDDRVVPSHSYKYVAELQHTIGSSPKQKGPLLLKVDTRSGHGAGKPTSKKINERVDIFAFLELALGYEFRG